MRGYPSGSKKSGPNAREIGKETRFRAHHYRMSQGVLKLEPTAGIEPATRALRKRCSTTELRWRQGVERTQKHRRIKPFCNHSIYIRTGNLMQAKAEICKEMNRFVQILCKS